MAHLLCQVGTILRGILAMRNPRPSTALLLALELIVPLSPPRAIASTSSRGLLCGEEEGPYLGMLLLFHFPSSGGTQFFVSNSESKSPKGILRIGRRRIKRSRFHTQSLSEARSRLRWYLGPLPSSKMTRRLSSRTLRM